MSIEKYSILREYKQGFADKILSKPCEDWSQKSSHYLAGWAYASSSITQGLLVADMNDYIGKLGHDPISFVSVQRPHA